MVAKSVIAAAASASLLAVAPSATSAFSAPPSRRSRSRVSALSAHEDGHRILPFVENLTPQSPANDPGRRAFLASVVATTTSAVALSGDAPYAWAEDGGTSDSFESIAARAARVSQEVVEAERDQQIADEAAEERRRDVARKIREDTRTIYDFTLPVNGKTREVAELVGQTFGDSPGGERGSTEGEGEGGTAGTEVGRLGTKVKAILVVNIKQDDPIARKNIPELIALASKFGKDGDFAVIVSPSDQGYYEPDTSALIRLKLDQEYGYGKTPGTILTDKVNLLGTGALPLWRWLEGSCRTPAGLGKIQANFEKFLVDGRTGKPLRRYPRKYQPYDMADDIAALVAGKPLPPAQANFKEEWRNAAKEAENDTYRFQKGLNYFDQ
ncbi:hypothetical protein ACHAWF_017244 [Thalassiosira exigua]